MMAFGPQSGATVSYPVNSHSPIFPVFWPRWTFCCLEMHIFTLSAELGMPSLSLYQVNPYSSFKTLPNMRPIKPSLILPGITVSFFFFFWSLLGLYLNSSKILHCTSCNHHLNVCPSYYVDDSPYILRSCGFSSSFSTTGHTSGLGTKCRVAKVNQRISAPEWKAWARPYLKRSPAVLSKPLSHSYEPVYFVVCGGNGFFVVELIQGHKGLWSQQGMEWGSHGERNWRNKVDSLGCQAQQRSPAVNPSIYASSDFGN